MRSKPVTDFTPEDMEPILFRYLTVPEIASMERRTARSVRNWIDKGEFEQYGIQPGHRAVVPVWAYLAFRRDRRVDRAL